jgi:hypothetical protein
MFLINLDFSKSNSNSPASKNSFPIFIFSMTFKKPDSTQKVYHYIEIDSTTIALYDSLMDQPISYGSKVKIQVDINKLLPKDITIYYYTLKQLIKLKPIKPYIGKK